MFERFERREENTTGLDDDTPIIIVDKKSGATKETTIGQIFDPMKYMFEPDPFTKLLFSQKEGMNERRRSAAN